MYKYNLNCECLYNQILPHLSGLEASADLAVLSVAVAAVGYMEHKLQKSLYSVYSLLGHTVLNANILHQNIKPDLDFSDWLRLYMSMVNTLSGLQIIFFSLGRTYALLRHHLGQTNRTKVRHHQKVRFTQRRFLVFHTMIQIKNYLDIMSNHSWNFVGHKSLLVGQCLVTDCYLQPCNFSSSTS